MGVAEAAVLSDVPVPQLHGRKIINMNKKNIWWRNENIYLHEPLLGGVQVDDLVHPGVVEVIHPLGAVLAVVLNLAQIFT